VREPSRFIEEMGLSAASLQLQPDTMSPKNRLEMLKAMLNKKN